MTSTLTLYPLSNYSVEQKESQPEEDASVAARIQRLQNDYEDYGMRRTVDGVMLIHDHGHPHVLMLQIANASFFKLPGDYLKPGEDDVQGLRTRMSHMLDAPDGSTGRPADWEISDLLGQWWRPHFETFMVRAAILRRLTPQYPYRPAHITKPKECKLLYAIQLPERSKCTASRCFDTFTEVFTVPRNYNLIAVPLFELYDNAIRYGPQLAAVAQQISRFQLIMA